ncbi:aminotransferase family protein [Leifsonia shinshuensis]|uniref:Aspartate aminotransferase family protein n=1 Tax=Leifsonia shinshuensis TaxID=150026 RepID=A0A7G6YA88_9MICO|nr:aminotransferase class III-fold pyridoxal phosphate-dependent enzyme [Leifsonia shinshuensis]QNE35403.1 aspartate aminotransferase family protein [Leifsonia shinshuensis]
MTSELAGLASDDLRYFEHGGPGSAPTEPFILERGVGCTVWDIHGRAYLDAHASAWLCQIGHGRVEMAEVAATQMARLEHFTTHEEYRNPHAVELARRLVELSPLESGKVRFSTSGSEADDDALQVVRRYQANRGLPRKTTILALRGAYHGHTYGGLELAGRIRPVPGRKTIGLTMPLEGSQPVGASITDYCLAELERVIAEEGAETIAAMFGEPVFGPAGMFAPPADYWPRVLEVLRMNDILFVADEVVTAFGRSGAWFGCELWGITPDVIVVAKGIASGYGVLSAVIISDAIADGLAGYHHGGSYAGNPVACALAVRNLEIIERESLIAAARERGAQLRRELDVAALLQPAVLAVRGIGLMVSVWLDSTRVRDRTLPLDRAIRETAGVIVMGNHSRIVITPPLTVTAEEVTRIVDGLFATLAEVFE